MPDQVDVVTPAGHVLQADAGNASTQSSLRDTCSNTCCVCISFVASAASS
jgi:hypothetical protein